MKLTEEDFWARVKKRPGRACWVWLGPLDTDGYGQFRSEGAHRWAVRYSGRDIPQGRMALHKCDRPFCVRPDHLYVGTYSDNRRDFCRRGMWNSQRVDLCAPKGYSPNRRAMYNRRRNHGLTVELAAAKIGITTCRLLRWEDGRSEPTPEQWRAWMKAFPVRRAPGHIWGLKPDPDWFAGYLEKERRIEERRGRTALRERKAR